MIKSYAKILTFTIKSSINPMMISENYDFPQALTIFGFR